MNAISIFVFSLILHFSLVLLCMVGFLFSQCRSLDGLCSTGVQDLQSYDLLVMLSAEDIDLGSCSAMQCRIHSSDRQQDSVWQYSAESAGVIATG